MKKAALLPLHVDSALRAAAVSILQEDETLNVERRDTQHEFIARGLLARDEAKTSGQYVSSDEILKRLEESLAKARTNKTASSG